MLVKRDQIGKIPDDVQSRASREGADLDLKRVVVGFRWQNIGSFFEERGVEFPSFPPKGWVETFDMIQAERGQKI